MLRRCFAPNLRPRRLMQMALTCLLTGVLAFAFETNVLTLERWWLVGVWWYTFSLSLWLADRRAHVFGPQTDTE